MSTKTATQLGIGVLLLVGMGTAALMQEPAARNAWTDARDDCVEAFDSITKTALLLSKAAQSIARAGKETLELWQGQASTAN